MLTRRIDAALDALAGCRSRVPALRDLFRDGTCERVALDDLLDALERADDALRGRFQTRRTSERK